MSKTKAGGRKRTVTITVGPITEKLAADIDAAMKDTSGNIGVGLTSLTGVGLQRIMHEWAQVWSVPIPKGWDRIGD